jgi:ribosomal protein S18 acetylase RimI-like enzyme
LGSEHLWVVLEEGVKIGMDCSHVQFCVHEGNCDGRTDSSNGQSIDLEQVQALFQLTAFWARDRRLEDWAIAIANSKPVVTVWARDRGDSTQPRLIGFARATSDGIYRATIWDVAIHPDYQGAGLGRKLVETVLMHPHVNRVERVYLMTTHQQPFYERIGFETNSSTTMVLFNQPVSREDLQRITEASQSLGDAG